MWTLYQCDPIKPGQRPENEKPVGTFATSREAFDEANRLRRQGGNYSYTVGLSE